MINPIQSLLQVRLGFNILCVPAHQEILSPVKFKVLVASKRSPRAHLTTYSLLSFDSALHLRIE